MNGRIWNQPMQLQAHCNAVW